MVHLPVQDNVLRTPRSHHLWGSRLRRNDREAVKQKAEPTSLDELELLAERATKLANRTAPSPDNMETVVRLLRQQYNMEFKLVCRSEECQKDHHQDEMYAPER